MSSSIDNTEVRKCKRDELIARIAARTPLRNESMARDARDDYRQTLVLHMQRPNGGKFNHQEWDALFRLWKITEGGVVNEEESDAIEDWWSEEIAKLNSDRLT